MLLRKRAWDLVREGLRPPCTRDDTVARAMQAVAGVHGPGTGADNVAVVLDRDGALAGDHHPWPRSPALHGALPCCPTKWPRKWPTAHFEEGLPPFLPPWPAATSLVDLADSEPLTVRPDQSLLVVLEDFVSRQAEVAVVAEAGQGAGRVDPAHGPLRGAGPRRHSRAVDRVSGPLRLHKARDNKRKADV